MSTEELIAEARLYDDVFFCDHGEHTLAGELALRLEDALALIKRAYTEWDEEGGYPTNSWRRRAEELGAWPLKEPSAG